MSWDVMVMRIPEGLTSLDEISEDFDEPLCGLREVGPTLLSVFPDLDLSDPTWGILEGDDFSIEFNIGDEDPCDSIMLHVRGGDGALTPIRALCATTGWAAIDAGGGELIDTNGEGAVSGFTEWQEFRKKALPDAPLKGVRVSFPI